MKTFILPSILLAALTAAAEDKPAPKAAPKPAPKSASWTAPTKKVNSEFPKWLKLGVEERVRMESQFGIGFKAGVEDTFALNRLRINMQITPLNWMKIKLEGQDSRIFGYSQGVAPASQKSSMDLRQGYLELGNTEGGRFAVRTGRQSLAFGEMRLVGDPAWSNTGRTFDAIRVTAKQGRYRVDAFAASVVKLRNAEFDRHTDADNFHGVYGSIKNPIPDSTLEPYGFWRVSRSLKSEAGKVGNQDTKTVGVRWVGKMPAGFDYNLDMARQVGSYSIDNVGAWAGHWVVGRTLANSKRKPRVFGEYNFASGDSNPKDGRRGTFDQLYASGHDKYGLADQFIWSNIHHARAGVEFSLRPTIGIKSGYHSFWLADAHDGLYASGKMVARVTNGSAGSHVGQELDAQVFWNYTKADQVNIGYGRIFPGEFLHKAMPGVAYNLYFVSIGRVF